MAAIKAFFKKKKLDVKFSKAGAGHRLNEEPPKLVVRSEAAKDAHQRVAPSESAHKAAEAALARYEQNQNPGKKTTSCKGTTVTNYAEKCMEEEKKLIEEAERMRALFIDRKEIEVEKPSVLSGVYFTCPLFEDSLYLPREELQKAVRQYLFDNLSDNPGEVSALIIHTFAKSFLVMDKCLETINKILDNIIAHPGEPKYRRIRMNNPRFKEEVLEVEGAIEFFKACGFKEELLPAKEGDEAVESFLVLPPGEPASVDQLEDMKRILAQAEAIHPTLYRDTKVFVATGSSAVNHIELPNDFFAISEAELKKEQEIRQKAVEESGMLLTKAMREKMKQKEMRRFRYALIRVRFPDNLILQGTFTAKSTLKEVLDWVKESLEFSWVKFQLSVVQMGRLTEEDATLVELGLAPSSVLNFSFDQASLKELTGGNSTCKIQYLKDELLRCAVPL